MEMVLADPQGITRMGLMYLLHEMGQDSPRYVEDKAGLIERLKECPAEIIILDYNLFDFYDANEMFILSQRFSKTLWLLFSEELSVEFMKMVMLNGQQFSIIMKDSPLSEIREALRFVMHGKRFICQHAMEMLLEEQSSDSHPEMVNLTKTEQEILKDIALGMTTKEIAAKRFSSFHTVNTHRKNTEKAKMNPGEESSSEKEVSERLRQKKGRNQEKFSFSAIHFCIIRGGFHICLAGRESMSYYGCTSVPISSPSITFLRLPFSSILKT